MNHDFFNLSLYKRTKSQGSFLCRSRVRGHTPLRLEPLQLGLGKAAAAKSLQSCPTLCDLTDGSPPGSPIPSFSIKEAQFTQLFGSVFTMLGNKSLFKHSILLKLSIFSFLFFFSFSSITQCSRLENMVLREVEKIFW